MENLINLDHPYSKHWSESYKTDHSHAKPIHWLLPAWKRNTNVKGPRFRAKHFPSPNHGSNSDGSEDEIDVESLDEVMSPYTPGRSYDVQRARMSMNETERFTSQIALSGNFASSSLRSEQEWQEYINKSLWTMRQNRLFSKVIKILEDEQLARLAFKGVNNEPIARRLSLDRSTACLRRILAEFSWDQKLTQWLHSLLINRLPPSLLASYLDLIQTLRSKVPTLVERMIMQLPAEAASGTPDTLNFLLKRPWEPILMKYPLAPKQRLYSQPIILLIPNSPYAPSPTMAHRKRFWVTHLSQLGKVVAVPSPEKTSEMTILAYVEQLAASVRSKISFYRSKYPRRSIVLVGWHTASILSCHVSLVDKVSAIVCLGFPTETLNGPRGSVDDVFCDMTTPTLFVVGEEADSSDINKIEDFREQLLTRCENYLLAVPGADDSLRVSEKVKKRALVTQQMVDRMILDYVSQFFSEALIKGAWQISGSMADEGDVSTSSRSGRRRRTESDELEIAEVKRRRISSATTAKISEILSGQSGRGSRTPVHGVMYNLQTGSLSGLATVPNVLNRSLSKSNDPIQALKTKGGRNKGRSRSITLDISKDAASQLKSRKSYRMSPDTSILPSGSQTEAAVATILGTDLSTDTQPSPAQQTNRRSSQTQDQVSTASTSAAYTSVSEPAKSSSSASQLPKTQSENFEIIGQYQTSKPKPAYTNVKFSSTVIQKKPAQVTQSDTGAFSTINKQHWSGILDMGTKSSSVTKGELPRKYPYLPPSATDNTTLISSRSRKDERETMQATAILEKLTSGLGNDADQSSSSETSQALSAAASYRRHSYDSTILADEMNRVRGRVRTRGGSSQSPLSREMTQRRRKTINEERPKYYQKPVQRYVMSSSVTSAIGASTKASPATKILQSSGGIPLATITPKPVVGKSTTKPSILPVYAFTQPSTVSGIKIQNLASPAAQDKSIKTTQQSQVISTAKKPSKVIVGQRLPVKFPGPVPGSSYTFVTIPALTGNPVPIPGQKKIINQPRIKTSQLKYSVIPKATLTVSTTTGASKPKPQAVVVTSPSPVSLRAKAIPKTPSTSIVTTGSVPVFTSPSVVLHKLWKETVAEMDTSPAVSTATTNVITSK